MAYIKGQAFIAQYVDDNGDNAENQTFEFYLSGTSTPTNVFKDSSGTVLGTSFTLNASGKPEDSGGTEVDVFFDDSIDYKIIHKDSSGTQIDPVIDPFRAVSGAISTATIQNSTSVYGVNNGSTTNAHAIDLTPTLTALAAGQKFHYIAPFANTGAVTLDIDGIGPAAVVWPNDAALVTGDIPLSAMIEVVYNGTKFHLISVTGRASTTQAGPIEIATDAEADAGTDTARAVTPAGVMRQLDGTNAGVIQTAALADDSVTADKLSLSVGYWALIETVTIASSGQGDEILFDASGNASYNSLRIVGYVVNGASSSANDTIISMQTGNDATYDGGASDYIFQSVEYDNTTGRVEYNSITTDLKLAQSGTNDVAGGATISFVIDIDNASDTAPTQFSWRLSVEDTSYADHVYQAHGRGFREESAAHDIFKIIRDTATGEWVDGEFKIYGLVNS